MSHRPSLKLLLLLLPSRYSNGNGGRHVQLHNHRAKHSRQPAWMLRQYIAELLRKIHDSPFADGHSWAVEAVHLLNMICYRLEVLQTRGSISTASAKSCCNVSSGCASLVGTIHVIDATCKTYSETHNICNRDATFKYRVAASFQLLPVLAVCHGARFDFMSQQVSEYMPRSPCYHAWERDMSINNGCCRVALQTRCGVHETQVVRLQFVPHAHSINNMIARIYSQDMSLIHVAAHHVRDVSSILSPP